MLPLILSSESSHQTLQSFCPPVSREPEKDLIFLSHDDVLQRLRDSFYILFRFLTLPSIMKLGSKIIYDTLSGPNIEVDENLCLLGLNDLNEWCADLNCSTGILLFSSFTKNRILRNDTLYLLINKTR